MIGNILVSKVILLYFGTIAIALIKTLNQSLEIFYKTYTFLSTFAPSYLPSPGHFRGY